MRARKNGGYSQRARERIEDATEYSDEELEFLKAMERYKREQRRRFPTFCEVLTVAKSLGYRKVE